MKTTRLIAAIALAFAATTATAAAKKLEVKVTGSRHDGIQYWVKYTINGVEYRSDEAAERVNQIAWGAMSHEDRLKTMDGRWMRADGYTPPLLRMGRKSCAKDSLL